MALFDKIQKSAGGVAWSQGVEMARYGAVIPHKQSDDEVVVQVLPTGALKPFEVYLWPDDEDWSCGCKEATRPGAGACAHVSAAVIAWKHGLTAPQPARSLEQTQVAPKAGLGRVGYRLTRDADPGTPGAMALSLQRVIRRDGRDQPLTTTLNAAAGKQSVLLSDADLAVEELAIRGLYGFRTGKGRVPRELARQLLTALSDCPDLTLDGKPVKVSGAPMIPRLVVEDDVDGGFKLRLVRDRRIEEVFTNGLVRAGEALHPIGDGGLDEDTRKVYGRGVHYAPREVSRLVSEVIPRFKAKIPVEVRTSRLPQAGATPPRMLIELGADGERLVITSQLVYGDPPVARLERGELKLLGGVVPVRDEATERKLVERLRAELGLSPGLRAEYAGEGAVRMAERVRSFNAGDLRMEVEGDGLRRFRKAGALSPRLQIDGDRFQMEFLAAGGGHADPRRVLQAWSDGAGLVPLSEGGWAPLPRDWLERYGDLLADLLDARDPSGKVHKHALFDLGRLADALEVPPPATLAGLRGLAEGFAGLPRAALPADTTAELRPYQQLGVDWLSFLRRAEMGGILADDMGLGKTVQTLMVLHRNTLIVAPTSVLSNWRKEAARFRPGLRVNLYHGPGRRLDPDADLTLTSYALLRLDAEQLCGRRWDAVVLDEAQAIKNPDAQVARAAFRLQADFRLTLTGTPVENRLEELWSQMHFLNPGLLGGRSDFDQRYARPIADGQRGSAERLRTRIKPFVLRRMKEEVARDLPPRTDMTLYSTLSEAERAVYDAVRAATKKEMVAQLRGGQGVIAALEALLRLRQAACHPALLPGRDERDSSKVNLLVETLEECVSEGHKALVFSQWTSLLDLVEPHLRGAGLGFTRLDGSTADRGAVVDRFQGPGGPPVMLLSLKAGGVGLNLTAADHVFLLDPWWNPAVEEQAADRVHRIGQDKPVFVYRMVSEDTVESRILELQERKRALADAVLDGADQAGGITREELLALLD